MITNLFSIFDPTTSTLSIAWLIVITPMFFQNKSTNNINSQIDLINNTINSALNNEISQATGNPNNGTSDIILGIFVIILVTNLSAIYPFVFSVTSQVSLNLPLALVGWTGLILMGWLNSTNNILSHIVPQGTPIALMNFIVLIELVSNIIRPITLCVRLTANIVAGHLLLSLLGTFLLSISNTSILIISIAPLILSTLESGVAFIQAYVFITLITLYSTEIH